MKYRSSKTYTHADGFSCCFRQWRAESHCHFLHGYALQVEIVFEGELDERNWVVDFGGLKNLKQLLKDTFDHKTLIATDDPKRVLFTELAQAGLIDIVYVQAVGIEAFCKLVYGLAWEALRMIDNTGRVKVHSVRIWEHPSNSAMVINDND